MKETVKIVGALLWIFGFIGVITQSFLIGFVMLAAALGLTMWVTGETRREKQDADEATRTGVIKASRPPSVSERLAEVEALRESGQVTDDEYQTMRQAIIDSP